MKRNSNSFEKSKGHWDSVHGQQLTLSAWAHVQLIKSCGNRSKPCLRLCPQDSPSARRQFGQSSEAVDLTLCWQGPKTQTWQKAQRVWVKGCGRAETGHILGTSQGSWPQRVGSGQRAKSQEPLGPSGAVGWAPWLYPAPGQGRRAAASVERLSLLHIVPQPAGMGLGAPLLQIL